MPDWLGMGEGVVLVGGFMTEPGWGRRHMRKGWLHSSSTWSRAISDCSLTTSTIKHDRFQSCSSPPSSPSSSSSPPTIYSELISAWMSEISSQVMIARPRSCTIHNHKVISNIRFHLNSNEWLALFFSFSIFLFCILTWIVLFCRTRAQYASFQIWYCRYRLLFTSLLDESSRKTLGNATPTCQMKKTKPISAISQWKTPLLTQLRVIMRFLCTGPVIVIPDLSYGHLRLIRWWIQVVSQGSSNSTHRLETGTMRNWSNCVQFSEGSELRANLRWLMDILR